MAGAAPSKRTKTTPPRRRQPEEVRARILDAAMACFADRGFDGTSVQRIARQAQASVPLLIYHFQSKENLWKATVEEAVRRFETRLDDLSQDAGLSATEKLRQIIVALVQVNRERPEFHRLMSLESHRHTERLEWLCARFVRRHFATIVAIIAAAQAEGSVRQVAPERLSHALVAMAAIPGQGAEFSLVTGHDLFSDDETQKTLDTINRLVFVDL
ncbi:MAG: TetR/AcrR family transcriptional regulator [Porticoccaceae bacterium]|jgi:AcrR family transcriptional regulator|nr:TetR/AcrR family transcriptional regulator [Porticoccaceae bacterium]